MLLKEDLTSFFFNKGWQIRTANSLWRATEQIFPKKTSMVPLFLKKICFLIYSELSPFFIFYYGNSSIILSLFIHGFSLNACLKKKDQTSIVLYIYEGIKTVELRVGS